MTKRYFRTFLLGTAALAASTTYAAAAELEEIIVTAQKREQRLQDVPISIAVVEGELLSERSLKSFQDLTQYVPSLFVTKTPGADMIIMRGIGSPPGSPSLDQSVVMFLDGVFAGNSRQFTAPFLDIERLEILRGPQGALVGKNTSAGAINILSRRPGTTLEGYAAAEWDAEIGGYKAEAAGTIPITEAFRVRVAALHEDYHGWLYNSLSRKYEPRRRENVVRGTVAYDTDNVSATLKYEHGYVNVSGNPFAIVSVIANRPPDLTKETLSSLGPDFDKVTTDNWAGNVSVKLGEFTLASITGYSRYKSDQREDADFFERDLAYSTFQEGFRQVSQEFRVLSPTGKTVEFVGGAYWHDSHLLERRTTGIIATPAASSYRPFAQDSTVYSAYGQVTFNVIDRLSAVGSLRYTHENKTGDWRILTGPFALTRQIGTQTSAINQSISENHTDPAFTLQYKPSDEVMLYGSYSHGSKVGGFQGAISNAVAASFKFAPETSRSFEAGAKMRFGNRATLNVAVFDTEYKNLQVSVAIQTTSVTSFAFYTGNAASAKARGVEADGSFAITDQFRVEGSMAYTPTAKFSAYPAGPCATGQAPTNPVSNSCNLTGARLGFIPEFKGTLTARFTTPISSGLKLGLAGTALFQSSARMDQANDPGAIQAGFTKVEARLALSDVDDRWELAVLGRNLTDVRNTTFSGTAALASNPNPAVGLAVDARQKAIDPPRTVVLQAKVRF